MGTPTGDKPELDLNTKRYAYRLESFPCGSVRQVLCNEFLLSTGSRYDQFPHGIRFSLGLLQKHGEPIFEGEQPWETGAEWVSVLRDGGKCRM